MNKRIKGFEPIVFKDSKVLLLGALPGEKSLKEGFYYADKSNYFWKFFLMYTGAETFPSSMKEAEAILKMTKVALWDILESAERVDETGKRTSSDKDISKGKENDIIKLCQEYPNIERIGVLGRTAYNLFRERFPELDAECLPSSSGVNARYWSMSNSKINKECRGWIEWSKFLSKSKYNAVNSCDLRR